MFQITVSYPTPEAAIEALMRLRGTEVPAPPRPQPAPAPATKAEAPAAQKTKPAAPTPPTAAAVKADAPAPKAEPSAPAADAVTPERVAALIIKGFVPKHKDMALSILGEFGVQRGKDLTDEQRPLAWAKLVAAAEELGIEVPAA